MKWFKHISDSLDDPFICELMEKHHSTGYLVFFGTLEIYAREFKTDPGWKLRVPLSYLRRKYITPRFDLCVKVLQTIADSGRWEITFDKKTITIFIPKFKELLDESTLKKLREKEQSFRNRSGIVPPDAQTDIELDKEVDIKAINTSLQTDMSVEDKSNQSEKSAFVFEKFRELQNKFPDQRYQRQIQIFIESFLDKRNPDAIVHALNSLLIANKKIINPKAYLEKILSVENGNYNYNESAKEHEEHKKPIPINEIPGLGEVLKRAGGGL